MTSDTTGTQEKRFFTTGEIAAQCDVSVGAVKKWIRKGKLDATRTPGGHFRVAPDEFQRFSTAYGFPRRAPAERREAGRGIAGARAISPASGALAALDQINRAVTGAVDRRDLGKVVLDVAEVLLPGGAGQLWEVLPDAGGRRLIEARGFHEREGAEQPLAGDGLAGLVALARGPVTIADLGEDARVRHKEWLIAEGLVSAILLPLLHGGRLYGTLNLFTRARHEFARDEVSVLESLALQAAAAIAGARLQGEAVRGRREADLLAELARGLNESPDLDTLMPRIAAAARELCRADQAEVAIRDAGRETLEIRYGAGTGSVGGVSTESGLGVLGEALLAGQVFRAEECPRDPRFTPDDLAALAEGVVALLAVPIRSGDVVQGALVVANRAPRPFTDADERTLARLADHAALALRAAREGARLREQAGRALVEIKAAQDHLVRGETLRALGELAGGAAHHLNNLLAVVWGRVQLLLRREEDAARRRSLEIVERATKDAADVVRRLQQFAHTEPADRVEQVNLAALAGEALEMTRVRWHDLALARGVKIEVAFERGELPLVCGDAVALREVIVNVVMNAVDALPGGGRITLASRVEDGMVALAVTDTGVGMSPEVLRRAREPFFTTKGVKSTGLGLSVSHGVLLRHGGELAIDSAEGRWTTVTLRLPVDSAPPAAAPAPALPAGGGQLRILVVDDSAEVREMLAALLTEQGHAVTQAAGGPEALAALAGGTAVDLVLTDLGMPDMNGWQVASAVKTGWPHLRVGIVTGWGDLPDAGPAESKHVDFVLAKPFSAETLQQAIAAL